MTFDELVRACEEAVQRTREAGDDAPLFSISPETYAMWKAGPRVDWETLQVVPWDWKDNARNRRRLRRRDLPNRQREETKTETLGRIKRRALGTDLTESLQAPAENISVSTFCENLWVGAEAKR